MSVTLSEAERRKIKDQLVEQLKQKFVKTVTEIGSAKEIYLNQLERNGETQRTFFNNNYSGEDKTLREIIELERSEDVNKSNP